MLRILFPFYWRNIISTAFYPVISKLRLVLFLFCWTLWKKSPPSQVAWILYFLEEKTLQICHFQGGKGQAKFLLTPFFPVTGRISIFFQDCFIRYLFWCIFRRWGRIFLVRRGLLVEFGGGKSSLAEHKFFCELGFLIWVKSFVLE